MPSSDPSIGDVTQNPTGSGSKTTNIFSDSNLRQVLSEAVKQDWARIARDHGFPQSDFEAISVGTLIIQVSGAISFIGSDGATVSVSIQPIQDGITFTGDLGFFGMAPQPQPTITGSTDGNTALQNLLSALESLGLIIDNTT